MNRGIHQWVTSYPLSYTSHDRVFCGIGVLDAKNAIHVKAEGRENKAASTWDWDGNTERPTFHPSIRVFNHTGNTQCHYFIRQGNIVFCGDSEHHLAGQTVALPALPTGEDNT